MTRIAGICCLLLACHRVAPLPPGGDASDDETPEPMMRDGDGEMMLPPPDPPAPPEPPVELTASAPASVGVAGFDVTFSCANATCTFTCDGADCTSPYHVTSATEGARSVVVVASAAGFTSATKTTQTSVDLSAPVLVSNTLTAYDTLVLQFSEPLKTGDAASVAFAATKNGLHVLSASQSGASITLKLSSALLPWKGYTLAFTVHDSFDHARVATAAALTPATNSKLSFGSEHKMKGDMTLVPADTLCNGVSGIARADCICQHEADAADMAGSYRALLSDSTNDAACRIRGLSGKKAGNCGLAAAPALDGPWIRGDGTSVSSSDAGFNTSLFFANPALRLDGATSGTCWTGSGFDRSVAAGAHCLDWTSAQSSDVGRQYGDPASILPGTSSYDGSFGCDQAHALVCMNASPSTLPEIKAPDIAADARQFFVALLDNVGGNFGGLGGADQICKDHASALNVSEPERYMALLSDDSDDAICRLHGLSGKLGVCNATPFPTTGAVIGIYGQPLAASVVDLFSSILEPVAATELGTPGDLVFTGTKPDGTAQTTNCANWQTTDSSTHGRLGRVSIASSFVDAGGTNTCDSEFGLICIQGP